MKDLKEKQDKEFEELVYDGLQRNGNSKSVSPRIRENLNMEEIKSHISKIRSETLQAVREEVEKHKDHERTGCIEVLLKSLDIKECDHQWTEDSLLCMACGESRVTITNS